MALADLLRPVCSLAARRDLGPPAAPTSDAAADARGEIDWVVCIDGTIVRAHQHAAGARHRPSKADRAANVEHPPDEALGRSRGGFTTKLHLACDGRGRPLAVVPDPGQRHESTQLGAVLDAIRVPRRAGAGGPGKRPDHLIADKGYSYSACRQLAAPPGIPHTIPERRDQRRGGQGPGAAAALRCGAVQRRNVAERGIGHLKQWRGVATRYEKRAANYRAIVVVAVLLRWLHP